MTWPAPKQPGPGQESVWDFPRPPQVDPTDEIVVVRFGGIEVCRTGAPIRVLETSHPPTYYLPMADFTAGSLHPAVGSSFCEFKGHAASVDIVGVDGRVARQAAWGYPQPRPGFEGLRDRVALYAGRVDQCWVDDELVVPQPGSFYGGWITSRAGGPFTGGRG